MKERSAKDWPPAVDVLPTIPPTLGTMADASCAWRVDFASVAKRADVNPAQLSLNVDGWLIYAPWAHPIWHSYVFACIALRDVEGWPPAHKHMANATHELFLGALAPDPTGDKYALESGELGRDILHPLNFAAQFVCPDDDAARKVMEHTVADVVAKRLSPDTDYSQHWIARFGASNIKGDPTRVGETRIIIGGVELVIDPVAVPPVSKQ